MNSKICVKFHDVDPSANEVKLKRVISMLHETTSMTMIDGAHTSPQLKGIDAIVGAHPQQDVIINGNFCFHSSHGVIALRSRRLITNRCRGIAISAGATHPTTSTSGNSPYVGPFADFIAYKQGTGITIQEGIVPTAPIAHTEALGGFGSKLENYGQHPWYGIADTAEKKVFFVITPYNQTFVGTGGAANLKQRLIDSGVPTLPGGATPGHIQCIAGDGGSSICAAYGLIGEPLKTRMRGGKHDGSNYYINTYLGFKTSRPR